MKKKTVLVIGELNVDLILNNIQSFPKIGTEILSKDMLLTMGSSSSIFACNLSTLGTPVKFLGKVGNDSFGDLVVDSLKKKNVNTSLIIRDNQLKTGATIILNYGEDRAMVTHLGAMEFLGMEDITNNSFLNVCHLHISSLFLQPKIKSNLRDILILAKNHGLSTSIDPQWDPEEKWDVNWEECLPLVDVFLPNKEELKALTGKNELDKAIHSIKNFSNIIAVKNGRHGSIGVYKEKLVESPPFLNNKIIDAIGAGDSFDAGFISRFIKKQSLEECLKWGNLAGSVNTTAAGGTAAFESLSIFKETVQGKFNVVL